MTTNLQLCITNYFKVLDEGIDVLSQKNEERLTGLPSWVHTTRRIDIVVAENQDEISVNISPDRSLDADLITVRQVHSIREVRRPMGMIEFKGKIDGADKDFFLHVGDMRFIPDNPLQIPFQSEPITGFGRINGFLKTYSEEKAKEDAINFWNAAMLGVANTNSYVLEVKNILNRLESIIKRKAFLERRVHRFIDKHKHQLLPRFKKCLFEHELFFGDGRRVADFILEREEGFPALLIELESPVHKVLTKKMDLTKEANHAASQIAEWVEFIDSDAIRNTSGEFGFLRGAKDRLVIIGRGLEYREQLLKKKFSGVVFWTYDMLILEAKRQLNDQYEMQCQMVKLPPQRPF